ncbi:MAG: hypothetical protein LBV47_00860 [Bacteroidales bacterium]|jgi:hypothetical protein|nr:hypothetical protein [Bacteroidales bacterium]
MNKILIILIIAIVTTIGVLSYFALKEQEEDESSILNNSTVTLTKQKEIQRFINEFETTLLVNVDIGKTDIERTLIIKYNNTVSAMLDFYVTCLEHDIDISNVDIDNPPDVISLELKTTCMDNYLNMNSFYNVNRKNISRELAQRLKFE